jgi:hypothetical protein
LREPVELLAACLETLDLCRWVDGHGFDYAQALDHEHSRRSAIEAPPVPRSAATAINAVPPVWRGELRAADG